MDWLDLPEVALIQVQNNLSIRDQLNVRLVCRYWKLVNETLVRRDELVLFFGIPPRPIYWLHDGRDVNSANAFLVKYFECMKSQFFLRYFPQVRRLMIAHTAIIQTSQPLIELIQASFLQLEHLQFNALNLRFTYQESRKFVYETNFHLPNLRTFYSQTGDMPLGLHCPRLTELYVYSKLNITEQTDSQTKLCIQRLRLLLVQALTYPPDFEFSNLEFLYFNQPFSFRLNNFPRLKELHYFHGVSEVRRGMLRDALVSFREQKRALKRNEIKFYFDGQLFEDERKIGDFEILGYLEVDHPRCALDLTACSLRRIKDGSASFKFDLLSHDLLVTGSSDDELMGLPVNDRLIEQMFRSTISILFMTRISKQWLNLFQLSTRFSYVFYVDICYELKQDLLNTLPFVLPNLVHFGYLPEFFSDHFVNFEFVSRFKSLYLFLIHRRVISMAEVRLIFEKCKFLGNVDFYRPNDVKISIFRPIGDWSHYQVTWISTDSVEFARSRFSTQELLDYLEASKWVEKNAFLGQRDRAIAFTPSEELVPPPLLLQPQQED